MKLWHLLERNSTKWHSNRSGKNASRAMSMGSVTPTIFVWSNTADNDHRLCFPFIGNVEGNICGISWVRGVLQQWNILHATFDMRYAIMSDCIKTHIFKYERVDHAQYDIAYYNITATRIICNMTYASQSNISYAIFPIFVFLEKYFERYWTRL